MGELKGRIESLLFSTGRRMTSEEIARLCKAKELERVKELLKELQEEYEKKEGSITLAHDEEDDTWHMTVRDKFLPYVRKVVTKTELPKGILETLAVLAYKSPMKQSDLIAIRTNKAYDHLVELEKLGYISRKKFGRTKILALAEKFFQYFDIPKDQLRERFKRVQEMEKLIAEREQQINKHKESLEEERKLVKQKEDEKKQELEEAHKEVDQKLTDLPEIKLVDKEGNEEELEVYQEGKGEDKEGQKGQAQKAPENTTTDTTVADKKAQYHSNHQVDEEEQEGNKAETKHQDIFESEDTSKSQGSDEEKEDKPKPLTEEDILSEALASAENAEKKEESTGGDAREKREGKRLFEGSKDPKIEEEISKKMEKLLHPEKDNTKNKEAKEESEKEPESEQSQKKQEQQETP